MSYENVLPSLSVDIYSFLLVKSTFSFCSTLEEGFWSFEMIEPVIVSLSSSSTFPVIKVLLNSMLISLLQLLVFLLVC